MSVIQSIQDKYAKLMAIIIALALIIFVIMLAFENGGSLFRNGNTNTLGKVNGQEINYTSFQKKVEQVEGSMKQQGYYGDGPAVTRQAIDETWRQEVDRLVVTSEVEKLGLGIGRKEVGDILYGENAPAELKQNFTDEKGAFNAAAAKQFIDDKLKKGSAVEKTQITASIGLMEQNRLSEKYTSLLTNSINYPKWMVEKQIADNSQLSKISFVRELYSSIPDSAVTVTDKEIEDFISKHKDQYKQEENRSISYVAFSALPTGVDSVATREKVMALKAEFDSTKDVKQFLETQGVQNFYNGFLSGSRIQVPFKDSIFKIPVGTTYGPYLDGGSYTLAKLLGSRTQPDTVNVRHILISTAQQDPQTGQWREVRDSATAYKLADSIRLAIAAGSNFDTLAVKLSEDQGKFDQQTGAYTGGKYENVPSGKMTEEFNDFIFGNPTGKTGIVKTTYGYHYIEILSQKGSSPAYKIAYIPIQVVASSETDAAALGDATKFAGDSRDLKSFDANAEKLRARGINKMVEQNLLPNSYQTQMGISRPLIKSVYDADLGDVLQPERVGEHYVVAVVTEVNKKGTMTVAKARPLVEPLLRNHKKAELLIKKVGNASTLEAAASAFGGKPIEVADSVRFETAAGILSQEPKVVGAAFNPANKTKVSAPIEGTSGVYVIRVDNLGATAVIDGNVEDQRQTKYTQAKMRGAYPAQSLKDAATIKDNRSTFY